MSNKNRTFLAIVMLVVFLGGAYYIYGFLGSNQTGEQDYTGSGEKVMSLDFTVQDMDGNTVNLSDYYGKPIVLNFWASWCPPCKSEMPDFNEAFEETGDSVVFLMINMTDGQRETIEKGSSYVRSEGFTFPVYYDTKMEAATLYNVTAIPTTYFIDKDGYIYGMTKGSISKSTLLETIKQMQ